MAPKFYHTSDQELAPGTRIRPHGTGPTRQDIEDIFERVRREQFPDRPLVWGPCSCVPIQSRGFVQAGGVSMSTR